MLEERVFLPEHSGVFYIDADIEKEIPTGWFYIQRSFREDYTIIKINNKWYNVAQDQIALMDEYPKLADRIWILCDDPDKLERAQGGCLIPSCKKSNSFGLCKKHHYLLIEMAVREQVGPRYDKNLREIAGVL